MKKLIPFPVYCLMFLLILGSISCGQKSPILPSNAQTSPNTTPSSTFTTATLTSIPLTRTPTTLSIVPKTTTKAIMTAEGHLWGMVDFDANKKTGTWIQLSSLDGIVAYCSTGSTDPTPLPELLLKSDGTVWALGENLSDPPVQMSGLNSVTNQSIK